MSPDALPREAPPRAPHDTPGADFPLQDYAALGDGRSVALVAPDGTVAWWCVMSLDSPPLFDSLLRPAEAGYFRLAPTGPYRAERAYRRDSNVLETTYHAEGGVARVTESLNSTLAGRLPWSELARRVEVLSGRVTFRARAVFGTRGDTASPWFEPNPHGLVFHVGPVLGLLRHTAHFRPVPGTGTDASMPGTGTDASVPGTGTADSVPGTGNGTPGPDAEDRDPEADRTIELEATLGEGERALVALLGAEDEPFCVPPIEEIDARIETSDAAWRAWADGLHYDGPHRDAVRRSGLALKLLLHSASGAIAAAATTSLPESHAGHRNWDYRYAWVRDAGYTVNAFLRLGVMPESKAAFTWLMRRLEAHGPRVVYTLSGGIPPDEETLAPYAGYRGAGPVVAGNRASFQHQHGIYGDIFETTALFVAAGGVLDPRSATMLSALADRCADGWRQPDSGIWELREARHYTMSKISAWQALARAVELAEAGHLPSTCVPRWRLERARIQAWIDANCWSERKRAYTFHAGTERLDASLALAVRFGFDGRERLDSTMDAIRRELSDGPFLYRYSGAREEEGAFLACTYWMVEALAELGRQAEAEALFDEIGAALAPGLGTLAEMADPATGAHMGNTPQGLSHLALIHAACTLGGDRGRPRGGPPRG